jgi:hypothetical protein
MQRDLRTELCYGADKHRLGGRILFRITTDFGDLYWHQRQSWRRTDTNGHQGHRSNLLLQALLLGLLTSGADGHVSTIQKVW